SALARRGTVGSVRLPVVHQTCKAALGVLLQAGVGYSTLAAVWLRTRAAWRRRHARGREIHPREPGASGDRGARRGLPVRGIGGLPNRPDTRSDGVESA